jgi:hypothetical protein
MHLVSLLNVLSLVRVSFARLKKGVGSDRERDRERVRKVEERERRESVRRVWKLVSRRLHNSSSTRAALDLVDSVMVALLHLSPRPSLDPATSIAPSVGLPVKPVE